MFGYLWGFLHFISLITQDLAATLFSPGFHILTLLDESIYKAEGVRVPFSVFRVPCSVFRPEQYLRNRYTDFKAVKSKVDLLHE